METPYSRQVYQQIYDQDRSYGRGLRCPGVREIPLYKHWLNGFVVDYGCGSGETVRAIRSLGFMAIGCDWVALDEQPAGTIVTDITREIMIQGVGTAICIDVLEHIPLDAVPGLLANLSRAQRQVISIHNGESLSRSLDGLRDLHVTKLPWPEWEEMLVACQMKIVDTFSPRRPSRLRRRNRAAQLYAQHHKTYLCESR